MYRVCIDSEVFDRAEEYRKLMFLLTFLFFLDVSYLIKKFTLLCKHVCIPRYKHGFGKVILMVLSTIFFFENFDENTKNT